MITPEDIRSLIETSLDDDKSQDMVTIDLAGKTSIADFMIVASGTSTRHVASMAQHVVEKLKKIGIDHVRVEGMTQCDWVLIDCADVIVHLFRPEVRSFYNLEKMWGSDFSPDRGQMPAPNQRSI